MKFENYDDLLISNRLGYLAIIMSPKEKIQNISMLMNSELTRYVALHDRLIRDQGSLWNTLKNLLGIPIRVDRLLEEVVDLEQRWTRLVDSLTTPPLDVANASDDEKTLLELLKKYVAAVQYSIAILRERQQLLYDMSKGGSGLDHTFAELQDVQGRYDSAVREYIRIGQDLNNLYHAVIK